MQRMRTIKAAVQYFKNLDPETAITEHFLRTGARSGELPGVVMAGSKYLVNLDKVEAYLSGSQEKSEGSSEENNYGKLRVINE